MPLLDLEKIYQLQVFLTEAETDILATPFQSMIEAFGTGCNTRWYGGARSQASTYCLVFLLTIGWKVIMKLFNDILICCLVTLAIVSCSSDSVPNSPLSETGINRTFFISEVGTSISGSNATYGSLDYFTADLNFAREDVKFILKNLNVDNRSCEGIVLFEALESSKNDTLNFSDIVSFATYHSGNEGLRFSLFVRDKRTNKYQLIQTLSTITPYISTKPLSIIASKVLPYLSSQIGTVCILCSKTSNQSTKIDFIKGNPLLAAAHLEASTLYKRNSKLVERVQYIDPSTRKKCGPQCELNNGNDCSYQGNQGFTCVNSLNLCNFFGLMSSVVESDQVGGDTVSVAFDSTLLRAYRDSSLRETDWGGKMITYYYYLWTVLDTASVPLSLKVQTARVLYRYNTQVIETIMGNPSSTNQLMSSTLKSQIIDLITHYKDLSSDTMYQSILSDLEDDVNTYYSYSVASFLSTIISQTEYNP